jgi:hypothetical protein
MQIPDGKTKFIVVPDNVAKLDFEILEKFLVKEFSRHRMIGTIQETTEINGLLSCVGKREMNLVLPQILCLHDGDSFHLMHPQIFLVIVSDWTGLL